MNTNRRLLTKDELNQYLYRVNKIETHDRVSDKEAAELLSEALADSVDSLEIKYPSTKFQPGDTLFTSVCRRIKVLGEDSFEISLQHPVDNQFYSSNYSGEAWLRLCLI
jgi:hypothetical protein